MPENRDLAGFSTFIALPSNITPDINIKHSVFYNITAGDDCGTIGKSIASL